MKDWTRKIIGLSLVALFAGYYGGTTLFYHAHEIDGVKIVHSHPYTGDAQHHAHSAASVPDYPTTVRTDFSSLRRSRFSREFSGSFPPTARTSRRRKATMGESPLFPARPSPAGFPFLTGIRTKTSPAFKRPLESEDRMRSHTADRTCRYRYTILTQTKKNMKYTLQVMLLLASCLSSEHMRAHGPEHGTNQLSGRIVDAETNQGIAYAVIQIEGTTLGTATDTAGFYSLSRLPESRPITAVASAVGYDRQKQTVAIIAGQQTRLDFKLRSTAIMEQIVVTADRQATKRTEAPTVVNVLSSKLFDQTSSGNIADALGYVSGLRHGIYLLELRNFADPDQRTGRPVFADSARQPPRIQLAGSGLRSRTTAGRHGRPGRGDPRRRLGPCTDRTQSPAS